MQGVYIDFAINTDNYRKELKSKKRRTYMKTPFPFGKIISVFTKQKK